MRQDVYTEELSQQLLIFHELVLVYHFELQITLPNCLKIFLAELCGLSVEQQHVVQPLLDWISFPVPDRLFKMYFLYFRVLVLFQLFQKSYAESPSRPLVSVYCCGEYYVANVFHYLPQNWHVYSSRLVHYHYVRVIAFENCSPRHDVFDPRVLAVQNRYHAVVLL